MNKQIKIVLLIVVITWLFNGCQSVKPGVNTAPVERPDAGAIVERQPQTLQAATDSEIKARLTAIQTALSKPVPVLTLLEGLDENQQAAQNSALADQRFLSDARDANSNNQPRLSEIFGVYPMRASDFVGAASACQVGACYRVEMYNFALNQMTTAAVNVPQKAVLSVTKSAQTQPDVPNHLTKLALHIATTAPEVADKLGKQPADKDAVMANTKTALNRTRCERSRHLCVAPTFVQNDKALWAIVDLTDLNLVGTRWTQVGLTGPAVTEKGLQNDVLIKQFCEHSTHLEKNGWAMDYVITSSDGLRVSNVTFKGKPVVSDMKLVDWHVNYSSNEGFGYSDAVGCPVFSQAAVVAVNGPEVKPIVKDNKEIGFIVDQDFWSEGYPTPCNYYYDQHYEFYDDGRFRPLAASVGRGCGNDGTYRPVTRIAFAANQSGFAEWSGNGWKNWDAEQWQLQKSDTAYTPEGYQYRVTNADNSGFYIEPSRGQFGDGGRGDNAFVYATRHHTDVDEGDSDLTTIGPCCNTDYHQGPEKYIEPAPEKLGDSGLVMWYVSQLKNDDTPGKQYCWAESVLENGVYRVKQYPCWSGPMIHPFSN